MINEFAPKLGFGMIFISRYRSLVSKTDTPADIIKKNLQNDPWTTKFTKGYEPWPLLSLLGVEIHKNLFNVFDVRWWVSHSVSQIGSGFIYGKWLSIQFKPEKFTMLSLKVRYKTHTQLSTFSDIFRHWHFVSFQPCSSGWKQA